MPLPGFFGPLQPVLAAPAAVPALPAAPAAGGKAKHLRFVMEPQGPSLWCWAATAASIATYYAEVLKVGQAMTQCQVAETCLTPLKCCPPPTDDHDPCNKEQGMDIALVNIGHRNGGAIQGAIEFSAIVNEIDGDRPICCHISWSDSNAGDGGHFVTIVGYDDASQFVDVCDCDPHAGGPQTLPLKTLLDGTYRNAGTWDGTYLTS